MFHHDLYPFLSLMVGIRSDRSPALYNAVFNMCVIADIHIIQNDGIFNITVTSDIGFLKDYGILHRTIDNTAAGNQAVFNLGATLYFAGGRSSTLE